MMGQYYKISLVEIDAQLAGVMRKGTLMSAVKENPHTINFDKERQTPFGQAIPAMDSPSTILG